MKRDRSPSITVIIPVYNSEKFLHRCLDSILKQDFKDYEIILVNDGSTDQSLDICNSYSAKDSRIIVITQKNAGVSAARNAGLKRAVGDYLLFVDSDDFILPGMFTTMIKAIEETNSDICVCQFANGDSDGKQYRIIHPDEIPLGEMNSVDFERIMTNRTSGYYDGIVCSPWNKLYKKELFADIHFFGNIGEDYRINDLINSYNKQVVIIPNVFYVYCSNPDSLTNISFNINRLCILDMLIKRTEIYSDEMILNDAKKIYCELYVEYYYKSKANGITFNDLDRKKKFNEYVSDLYKSGKYNLKFFVRMMLFRTFPWLYKKIAKL